MFKYIYAVSVYLCTAHFEWNLQAQMGLGLSVAVKCRAQIDDQASPGYAQTYMVHCVFKLSVSTSRFQVLELFIDPVLHLETQITLVLNSINLNNKVAK